MAFVAVCAALIAFAQDSAWAAEAGEPVADDLEAALAEMREIEAAIEALLLEQAAREERIAETGESLEATRERLEAEAGLRVESERAIEALGESVRRDVRDLQLRMQIERERLERARRGAHVAAALRLHAAQTDELRAALPAEEKPDKKRKTSRPRSGSAERKKTTTEVNPGQLHELTLALLERQHRVRAQAAVDEMLRLEARRTGREEDRSRLAAAERRYAVGSGIRIDELRRRHREVAERLERLRGHSSGAHGRAAELADRRTQLDSLIRGLEASRSGAAFASAGSERLSVLPQEISGGAGEAGAPADAVIEPEFTAPAPGQPMAFTEGYRWVFWRARSSRVRALAQGTVLFSGKFAGYRHVLILDHGGGWASVYGNMNECFVGDGESVGAGEAVGQYQAQSAGQAEPLWVEVRRDAEAVSIDSLPPLMASGEPWMDRLFGAAKQN